ncbi:hypothetical protein scyTo_0015287 [Scyliorhinus torazame]|uniref:Uncharacterized protein n=1 Tax=Scyliorhinus torazame TaxID=75743 RepID=A0A401PQ77_SCYTO|nr:hypothetical protein [Scyliorhinus torazame]
MLMRSFMTWSGRSIGKHQRKRVKRRNPNVCCFKLLLCSRSEPGMKNRCPIGKCQHSNFKKKLTYLKRLHPFLYLRFKQKKISRRQFAHTVPEICHVHRLNRQYFHLFA